VFKNVAANCNVLRPWMLQPKKKNQDKKVVVACSKVAQGVEERCQMVRCVMVFSCWLTWVQARCRALRVRTGRTVLLCAPVCGNALRWVAPKFRYINIYDNRYVNMNKCVYKDKCIWNIRECIKAKANHSYEQNKDTVTRAAADGEKGNTTIDRATCLCIRCSIVYGQVERSRDGGISDARGIFDGSGSVARGSFDGSVASDTTRNRAVACADCGIRVAHGADCGIGVAEVSDGGCSVEGSSSMDDAPEATRNHAVEGVNGSIDVAHGADCGIGVAHGSDGSRSVEGRSSVADASEATRNHAVEGTNGSIGVAHGANSGIGVAHSSDGRCSVDGSSSVDDASESTRDHAVEGANLIIWLKAWEITQLRMRIWRMTNQ